MRKYLLAVSIFLCFNAYSQKTPLIIYTKPSSAQIKLDGKDVKSGWITQADSGFHSIHVWKPHYRLVTDSIQITNERVRIIRTKLEYTNEYLAYKKERKTWFKPLKQSLGLTVLFAGGYFLNNSFLKKAEKDADEKYSVYTGSFSDEEITKSKTDFDSARKKYNSYRKMNNAIVIAGGVLIPAAFVYSGIYFKKHKKPAPNETVPAGFAFNSGIGLDEFGNLTANLQVKF